MTQPDNNVYISYAEIAYEHSQTIGVFQGQGAKEEAIAKCLNTPYADENKQWKYDRHWVEVWQPNGYYIGTIDVRLDGTTMEHE